MTHKETAQKQQQAQCLRDSGLTAEKVAEKLKMSVAWVKKYTQAGKKKIIRTPATKNEQAKMTCVYGIWLAARAVQMGCEPSRAIDVVASTGMVRKGGVPV